MNKYYAVKAKSDDIRRASSSGGMFYILASSVINDGGVVYGAVYDDNFSVVHSRAVTCDELKAMHGSKYSKSDFLNVMTSIGEDLENGKKVLFSGTPCQVNTVKAKFKDSLNLYTVDVVCHGTPSKEYLADYIKYLENKYHSKVKFINMRYKEEREYIDNKNHPDRVNSRISPHYFYIEFENGRKINEKSGYNIYYQLFDYFITSGCFKCPFAKMNRVSDITIGDFHEFNTKLGNFNDSNGVSLVIVSTEKGEKLFKDNLELIDLKEYEEKQVSQPALVSPAKEPTRYLEFNEDYNKYGFEYVAKKYCKKGVKFKLKKVLDNAGVLKLVKNIKEKI